MNKGSRSVEIDATDMKILQIVQENGRLSNAEIAEQVSLSPSPCWKRLKRLKRLESSGMIRGYQAMLDRRMLGFGVVAFVNISLDNHTQKVCRAFEAGVMAMPEVIACHNTTGAHDYLLQILAEDFDTYSEFVLDRLRTLPGVKEMLSTVSMRELKSSVKLPLR
ncbi:Lrp/AsnC family transcriptional regulator [Burkholderia gladioli]|uniref:Lrp/AsnC family transcriptional regulator n=1 Tax=Burkholderia gladioli TaxID=28095 RepID=UPI003F7A16DF